ncbi:MAG: hypothetical protein PHH08_00385 [Candidatus ainarchaeum sp.]|nr:hypothetical protein [Candidatus ainarchaeum sp.]
MGRPRQSRNIVARQRRHTDSVAFKQLHSSPFIEKARQEIWLGLEQRLGFLSQASKQKIVAICTSPHLSEYEQTIGQIGVLNKALKKSKKLQEQEKLTDVIEQLKARTRKIN